MTPSPPPDTLGRLLEHLDEDHGHPDGTTLVTATMVAAEEAFHAAVLQEYKSWNAVPVPGTLVRIDVRQWVAEFAPDMAQPEVQHDA